MQSRTLLTVLTEIENIFPEVREGMADLKKKLPQIQNGDWSVDIEDRKTTNLYNLVAELKQKYKDILPNTLEKNILARIQNAIYDGDLYLQQGRDYMKECMLVVNRQLSGNINIIFPPTSARGSTTPAGVSTITSNSFESFKLTKSERKE